MPLQDRFGKRTKPSEPAKKADRTRHLTSLPSMDDLNHALLVAQEAARQPTILTWKREGVSPMYLLSVIRNSEGYEPTWTLNSEEANKASLLWTYTTSDSELIYSLVTEQVSETGPAAVIPESLRPRITAEIAVEQEGTPQTFENYELVNTLGRGGMGIVYKARHKETQDLVALKVLRADLLIDKANVERFKHEATAASSLVHPNLIKIREFGISRYGQPYISMDYLEGVELQALLAGNKHLDLPTFVNIFTQICGALAYAHDQGLVHRDLKPGNIMLVKNPNGQDTIKIIDFGIAKSASEASEKKMHITTTGNFLGSPAYMSPEQCGGAVLDSRSDIYSLGCVMYEAVTGVLPFRHDSMIKTIMMHVNDLAAPFALIRPELRIPEELERIVFRALEKDPECRYQTAAELNEDLWAFAATGYSGVKRSSTLNSSVTPTIGMPVFDSSLNAKASSLLKKAGVISERTLRTAAACELLVEEGRLTVEQAIELIKDAHKTLD